MSHCLGVMCLTCRAVLQPDTCPEGCTTGHGFGLQEPNEWAAKMWPEHPCYQRDSGALVDGNPADG